MTEDLEQICTTQTLAQVQAGAVLVDLRESVDAKALAFDVPGLIHLPMSQLRQRWRELPRDLELILACQTGEQSATASLFLRQQGHTRLSPMRGGILLWMQKGYPVQGRRFDPADPLPMHKE